MCSDCFKLDLGAADFNPLFSSAFRSRGIQDRNAADSFCVTLSGYTEPGKNIPMCLGIPMQIVEIDGFNARCQAKGVERDVSLFLMQGEDVQVGDFVMVHVGYAIQRMSQEEARSAWELYDEMLAAEAGRA